MSEKLLNELKKVKTTFQDCDIYKDEIVYFASGNSILDIPEEDLKKICYNRYVITTNYGFEYFLKKEIIPNLNIHSDKKVTNFINDFLSKNPKNFKILSRANAFNSENVSCTKFVDYWFDENEHRLGGNYTAYWLLAMLERFFPDKKVYVFGIDLYFLNDNNKKFYDSFTSWDKDRRVNSNLRHLDESGRNFDMLKKKEMFFNCNMQSKYQGFKKIDYKTII